MALMEDVENEYATSSDKQSYFADVLKSADMAVTAHNDTRTLYKIVISVKWLSSRISIYRIT